MKYLVITGLIFSSLASAQVTFEKLPSAIICESKGISQEVKSFELLNLNTNHPSTSIGSPLIDSTLVNNYVIDIGFSDFCENAYGIVFFLNDLIDLKSGKMSLVQGIMRYNDHALRYALGTEEDISETVSIFCRMK